MLEGLVNRYFEKKCPLDVQQRRSTAPQDHAEGVWKGMATELGILGLTFPETLGGSGGGAVDIMIVMEAIGRHLVVQPFLETVVIGGGILQRSAGDAAKELIGKVILGDARIALAHMEFQARYCLHDVRSSARAKADRFVLNGRKMMVSEGPRATHYIVSARTGGGERERDGISLFLVDAQAKGVHRRDYKTIDWRPAADIDFENVSLAREALLGEVDAALPLIEETIDRAILAVCAEGTTVLQRILADTVEYTQQRRQFGVPLSSFQALRHRMVDMYIVVEEAMAMSREASRELDEGVLDTVGRARSASALKVCVGQACNFVGESGVQLHGAMGIADETALSHYFKRAQVIEQTFGTVDHHLARFQTCAFTPNTAGRDIAGRES
jgi:alkylation response protein AidB-like acyl-CoA dehydrogenase